MALLGSVVLASAAVVAAADERPQPLDAATAQSATVSAAEADSLSGEGATNPGEHLGHEPPATLSDSASSTPPEPPEEPEPDPEPNDEAEAAQAEAGSREPPPGGPSPSGPLGIPERALSAYKAAAASYGSRCSLGWEVLAAIGRAESGHARGGQLFDDGTTWEPILGPVLDGNGFARISDSDDGRLDGDDVWDRAVGPMQFIPGTWAWIGVDADGDGAADPHDIDDAAAGAARYLCLNGGDLSEPEQLLEALLRYNASSAYAEAVMAWADGYAGRATPVQGPTAPEDQTTLDETTGEETAGASEQNASPTPAATPSPSPSPSMTPTPSPSPAESPAPSPTPSPTPAESPVVTPTPSPTQSPTATPTPSPSATPTPAATESATSTPTVSESPTVTPSATSETTDEASTPGS